jgi:predicted nucleotidyltransferase
MLITKEGLIAQALGLPLSASKVPIIPKYVISKERSPWELHGIYFSRIISEYGPKGLSKAVAQAKSLVNTCFSETFLTEMPCVDIIDVLYMSMPQDALQRILRAPRNELEIDVIEVLSTLKEHGISVNDLGITGSTALGFGNPAISDIDLIVYDNASLKILELFTSQSKRPLLKENIGGLRVRPPIDVSWRRAYLLKRRAVSWIGVPEQVLSHCDIVRKYPPLKQCKIRVHIEPEQEGALLYPPCVVSIDGRYVVSFEYNLAYELYMGGTFEIKGMCSEGLLIVYLGTRESPGFITRIK